MYSLDSSETCVHFPVQQEDEYSTSTEISHPVSEMQHSSSNTQTGVFAELIGKSICLWMHSTHMYFLTQGDLSKFIKINEQPKDQIIRFKNNEATVELTCIAESPEGYDLHYEWYCVNSDCIKSVNCHAELKFKKPPKNMEEQYCCKVSTANDSRYCLMSKTVVIKLEISKYNISHNIWTLVLAI